MSLVPVSITDEQAKAIQESAKLGTAGLDTAKAVGTYFARVFGTLPENLVGLLGADWVEFKRFENLAKLTNRAQEIARARGVGAPGEVSLSLGLPLLRAAADESREELADLWARLLAAAMDPQRASLVRRYFIDIVRQMDPLDARVFDALDGVSSWSPNGRDFLAGRFGINADAVEVSLEHLLELGLISRHTNWSAIDRLALTALGREFKRALPPDQ